MSECKCNSGTILKEYDNTQHQPWNVLCEMTEVCRSCGEEVKSGRS